MDINLTASTLTAPATEKHLNYVMIPAVVVFMELSQAAFKLYAVVRYTTGEKEGGVCFKSLDTLSQETGLSPKTITKARRELEAVKLIRIRKEKNPHGGHDRSYMYVEDVWLENSKQQGGKIPYCNREIFPIAIGENSLMQGGKITECKGENLPTNHTPLTKSINQSEINHNNARALLENDSPSGSPKGEDDVGLSICQKHFLEVFHAKRFKNNQANAIKVLEDKYGSENVIEKIDWAGKRGMNIGAAVTAIEGAFHNMEKKKAKEIDVEEIIRARDEIEITDDAPSHHHDGLPDDSPISIAWRRAIDELRRDNQVPRQNWVYFNEGAAWPIEANDENIIIGTNSDYAAEWLTDRMKKIFEHSMSGILGKPVEVGFQHI